MKKVAVIILVSLCVLLSACGKPVVSQETYDQLLENYSQLEASNAKLSEELKDREKTIVSLNDNVKTLIDSLQAAETTISELDKELDDIKNGPAALIVSIRNSFECGDWAQVVSLSEELHEKANGSEEDIEAQSLSAKANKEIEKAEKQRIAEEKKGYETGITYSQIVRNPDDYKLQKVTFRGSVFQSFEQGNKTVLMIAVGGNFNSILYVTISTSELESRIIENDWVTVRGLSNGIFTYESSGRGTLSVPWITADIIER